VPPEAIVIYDEDCGFCRWSLALLLRKDRGALRPLPLGTPEADYLLHDLTPAERGASWHLVIDPPAAPGPEQLSFDALPVRCSAGAALAPALSFLPRGRRWAGLVARIPGPTDRTYDWIADHRRFLGHLVPGRARRWADQVIAAHGAGGRTRGRASVTGSDGPGRAARV
jgi:predicted DCC family thiol-disulfide oxidoreductase YuxK